MRHRALSSIRARLTLGFLLGATLLLLVANVALDYYAQRNAELRAGTALQGAYLMARAQVRRHPLPEVSPREWVRFAMILDARSAQDIANGDEGIEVWLVDERTQAQKTADTQRWIAAMQARRGNGRPPINPNPANTTNNKPSNSTAAGIPSAPASTAATPVPPAGGPPGFPERNWRDGRRDEGGGRNEDARRNEGEFNGDDGNARGRRNWRSFDTPESLASGAQVLWHFHPSGPRFSFPGGPPGGGNGSGNGNSNGNDNRPPAPPQFQTETIGATETKLSTVDAIDNPSDWWVREFSRDGMRLILGVPKARVQSALRERAVALAALSAFSLLLLAPGTFLVVGRSLRPIGNLVEQAHNQSERGLNARLLPSSTDREIEELVSTLNGLIERAASASQAQSRFHTAASHELRTPLAGLSGLLEVTLSRPRNADEYRVALENALVQSQRLGELTRDLLLLNRLQTGAARPPGESLDVADIADHVMGAFKTEIAAHGLALQVVLNDSPLEAPPAHIEALTRNLLENAVKYADEKGQIQLQTGKGFLEVWNQNTEAQPDESWFEPFFRPDAARDSQTGGNGLGLAICHAICDFHGWKISITRAPNNELPGVKARVEFNNIKPKTQADLATKKQA